MFQRKPATRRGKLAAALLLAFHAAAVLAGPTAKFDIPAQPLSSALRALASQAGVQLVFMPETVGAAKGVAVQGEMSVEAALRQLLAGSGLEFRQEGERNYVVVHSPSSARESTLPEMVVTATKTAAPLRDVPFAMSVVGAEAIGQQSPRDISDILRREAGVDINRSTPLGVATVSIRGGDSAAQRTQVLIDGQPSDFISTGVGGLTALQIVDPQNVERVEIVRGAGSALYGPSAVGGVVNIITRRGDPARPQTRVFAGVEERGSSHAGFASSGGNAATGFTYQINGRHARYGGYKPEPTPTPNDSQSLQNIRDRTDAIGGRLGFWFTDRNELAVTLNAQEARGDSFGRPETRYAIGNRVLGLESNNWLSDAYRLSVAVSQRSHRGDYDFDSFFASDTPPSTARTSTLKESADKLSIDIKNQWDVATGHRLLFGLQYVKDDASLRYFTPTTGAQQDDRGGSVKNLGLYVQDEMRFGERWFLTAGLRHDRFDYDLHYSNFTTVPTTARTVSKSWQTTNPRLGARYRLTAATDLRASVGKAFRAPDTFGLMGRQLIPGVLDFRPNLNLDAEKATTVDLGFDHDFGGGLKTSVTVYQTEIKDAMVVTRTGAGPMVLQWNNLGKLVNEGVELEVRKRFGDAWQTYANYTHSVSRAASEPPAGAVGWPCNGCKLALNPVHKLAFGVTYRPSDVLVVRGDGRYVSESYATGDTANTQANRLPGYFVADIKATWYRKFGKDRGELSAGLRNLAGQKYATRSVGTYEEPRTAFVQLGYSVF
jgi:outer membrane receptor protein involved in Fe transport